MEPAKEPKEKVPKRKKKFIGCSQLDHFELGHKVGVGTFGEVIKAKHITTGKTVALKKIFTKSEQEGFPITSLREIKLLKNVSHPNVASLIDMAVSYCSESKDIEDVYMVFPFMDHDLTGILENQSINLTLPQIKCYMKQLLEGISHLHSRQIMHRDLKGANLLVNNRGELKITDFGLARPIEENRVKYTPGVVTRWYRPPELLLGTDIYNESIDIWGAGCIIAEMYLRKPLFGASSDIDQLKMVCCYCGTPTEETYPGVGELPDFSKIQLKPEKRILKDFLALKQIDKAAIDLIDKMLVMDPKKRITAKEALNHEYFTCDPLPCLSSEIEKFESSHVYTVQQQKEKEIALNKRSRPDDFPGQELKRNNKYLDYDARPTEYDSMRNNDRIRYTDRLTPPPPPPPQRKDRELVRDYDNEMHQRDRRDHSRDYNRRRDYYDHDNRKDYNYHDRRDEYLNESDRRSHRSSSHEHERLNSQEREVKHRHGPEPIREHNNTSSKNNNNYQSLSHSHYDERDSSSPVERRVFNSSNNTAIQSDIRRGSESRISDVRVSEARVNDARLSDAPPQPPPPVAHERNRRSVSYDDL